MAGDSHAHVEEVKVPRGPIVYNDRPLRPLGPPTDFDSVLFKDIKLKQFPKFLWQHTGAAGYVRLLNYMDRKIGGVMNPHGGMKLAGGLFAFWTICALSNMPFEMEKKRHDFKVVITHKYGWDNYQKMHPIEKGYLRMAVWRKLAEGH
jgi:hypothetical protein